MRDRIIIETELDAIRRQMTQLVIQQSDIDQRLKQLDRNEMMLQRELEEIRASKG